MLSEITQQDRQSYQEAGYLHLRNILNPEALQPLTRELRGLMESLNPNRSPLEERSTYRKAFNQVTNLWQRSETVKHFVFRKDLARLAADIMGVSGVRLYHDQALFKEAGGGPTPWHVDQVYWPMDTPKTCTFWIPLQDTPVEMGTLSFARGSHHRTEGREMVISDASEAFFSHWVSTHGFKVSKEAFRLGDISIHSGWTVHRAGPNLTPCHREVMTIIYMDAASRLKAGLSETQIIDRDAFTPGIKTGQILDSPMNPVLYQQDTP